jgi:hypothetical protein
MRSNPCNGCTPLPFIVTRGKWKRIAVPGCWDVPPCAAVRQDELKWSRATWSWEPPRGRGMAVHPGTLGIFSE